MDHVHRLLPLAAALPLLLLLTPAPAAAQSPSGGPDHCGAASGGGFGTWTSSMTPRLVVAGQPATYTVVVRGPVNRASVSLHVQQKAVPEGGSSTSPAQVQTSDARFPLAAGETATYTVRTTPTTNATGERYGAVYCGPGPFHGDVFGANRETVLVAPRLTLAARREAPRRYLFSGSTSRPGQLLSLYRVEGTGRQVLTAQTRARADGTWSVRRTFLGSGRFGMVLRTARDVANEPGASNLRPTVVH